MHTGSLYMNALNMSRILYAVIFSLISLFLLSCGRRGDPVAIEPQGDPVVRQGENIDKAPDLPVVEKTVTEEGLGIPAAPTDLIGVYAGSSVILTWGEVKEQEITLYRIYRSREGGSELIGESVTPAFTDRDVEKGRDYYYRVSAVASSEGPLSETIRISTIKR